MRLSAARSWTRSLDEIATPTAPHAGPRVPAPAPPRSRRAVGARRQAANLLTALRLALALPVVLLVLADTRGALAVATLLFALGALSDLLDGRIARRWGHVSTLGAFLDPLADKCLIDGCMLALVARGAFPLPLAALFAGRDLVVTLLRLSGRGGRARLRPSRAAKLKTCALYAGLPALLLGGVAGRPLAFAGWSLVLVAAALSLVTAGGYVARLWQDAPARAALALYLLFPRPGPLLSLGKVAFFVLGSFIALCAGFTGAGVARWLLVFAVYELVLSQGKYLFNDLAGRGSDGYFLRGASNRCPAQGRGAWWLAGYALAREVAGVAGLLLLAGPIAALIGVLTLLLQAAYELLKLTGLPSRGGWLFLAVSINYGLRALAGMVAVQAAAPLTPAGLLTLLWATGLGALFLSLYWQRQGEYYLLLRHLSPSLLARYKPGMLAIYRGGLHAGHRGRAWLPERLLQAIAAGAVCFAALGGAVHPVRFGLALVSLAWALLAPLAVRHAGARALATALAAASGSAAVIHGLATRSSLLLPFALVAVALLAYQLLQSAAVRPLVLHGADAGDPEAA